MYIIDIDIYIYICLDLIRDLRNIDINAMDVFQMLATGSCHPQVGQVAWFQHNSSVLLPPT